MGEGGLTFFRRMYYCCCAGVNPTDLAFGGGEVEGESAEGTNSSMLTHSIHMKGRGNSTLTSLFRTIFCRCLI